MYKLVVVGTIVAMAAAHPISQEMVNKLRSKPSTWEAYNPMENPLKEYTHDQLLNMLGTYIVPTNGDYKRPQVVATPSQFDAREQWPSYVHAIRDQQSCGSCWAFGASEALSDRFAIASAGKFNEVLSPEDMVSCDQNDYGCGGGYMDKAWQYLEEHGIVTDKCFPYTAGSGVEAPCASKCVDGAEFKKFKCQKGSIVNPRTVDEIKSELYTHGPLEGAFTVYEDFFNYKSGVYQHKFGGIAGGHAIKVLGYGTDENGTDYWLCANSWGAGWGEKGFFRIKQGDSGINQQMFGCTPDLAAAAF